MSPITLDQLLQHEAFRGLSQPYQQRLREELDLLTFELGEPLVEAGVIPGRVLILVGGRARLVGNDQGRLISLCLLYTSPSPRDVEESRMPSSA